MTLAARYTFLDPALFCWNVDDYLARPGVYWALVEDLTQLLEILEEASANIVWWGSFVDSLIESFPVDYMYSGRKDLRDFSNSLLTFLTKWQPNKDQEYSGNIFSCVPDLSARSHFCATLKDEAARGLSALVSHPSDLKTVFSHSVVLGAPVKSICFPELVDNNIIDCVFDGVGYASWARYGERIYEKHSKHDQFCGYGSKLPECLSDEDMQALLDSAQAVSDESCLIKYSDKAGTYLIFREHRPGRYHGYPIAANELSRMKIPENIALNA